MIDFIDTVISTSASFRSSLFHIGKRNEEDTVVRRDMQVTCELNTVIA